jgi:hypothetical protein
LLPNQETDFVCDGMNGDIARHRKQHRGIVSNCFKEAEYCLLRGYHGMHVAASGGSVPGAKWTNKLAVSRRQHHYWPKQLPNARVVIESQLVVRGYSVSVSSQPLGRH